MTVGEDALEEIVHDMESLLVGAEELLTGGSADARIATLEEVLLEQVLLLRDLVDRLSDELSPAAPRVASEPGTDVQPTAYRQMSDAFRTFVEAVTPTGASVLVVSKGDGELLLIPGRTGSHFPQTSLGSYAGYHPDTSATAIEHLEALRLRGAEFIAFPGTARWWLDHYEDLRTHLEVHHALVADDPELGLVWDLRTDTAMPSAPAPAPSPHHPEQLLSVLVACLPQGLPLAILHGADGQQVSLRRATVGPELQVVDEVGPFHAAAAWATLQSWNRRGVRHLVVPATSVPDVPDDLWAELAASGRTVIDQRHTCQVIELHTSDGQSVPSWSPSSADSERP